MKLYVSLTDLSHFKQLHNIEMRTLLLLDEDNVSIFAESLQTISKNEYFRRDE